MLEGSKETARRGILIHRLQSALTQIAKDFPSDKATLERHASRLAKLRERFETRSKAISDAESEALWRDKPNQARPSSGDKTST
jgi:hypothetical protein